MKFKLDETQAVVGTLSADPTINGYIDGSRAVCRIGLNYRTNLSK